MVEKSGQMYTHVHCRNVSENHKYLSRILEVYTRSRPAVLALMEADGIHQSLQLLLQLQRLTGSC